MKHVAAAAAAIGFSAWAIMPGLAAASPPDLTAARSDAATRTDFTRLSIAGNRAFVDVGLARLAIFDGKPARAGHLIGEAEAAFDQATTDHTSFVKAENRLNPPASVHQAQTVGTSGDTPTAWIPVGESFVLDETLTAPEQAARAIEKANASLHANHRRNAVEMLKVANVSAADTVALVPLEASIADIHRAAELTSGGDYYGANQSLRALENGVRFDTVIANGKPGGKVALSSPGESEVANASTTTAPSTDGTDGHAAAGTPAGDHVRN